jgi:hypothetical protein
VERFLRMSTPRNDAMFKPPAAASILDRPCTFELLLSASAHDNRPTSTDAMGRPPIYPTGSNPKETNQRDLPTTIIQGDKASKTTSPSLRTAARRLAAWCEVPMAAFAERTGPFDMSSFMRFA